MSKVLRKVFPGGGTPSKLAAKPEAEPAAAPAAAPSAAPAAAPSTWKEAVGNKQRMIDK